MLYFRHRYSMETTDDIWFICCCRSIWIHIFSEHEWLSSRIFLGIIAYLVIVYLPITIVGCCKPGFRRIKLYKVCDLIFNLLLAGFIYNMFYVVRLRVELLSLTESIYGLEVVLDLISICWCRRSYWN